MRIDVKPILHTPGKRLDFQFSLDLSDVEFAGRRPISRPVEVEGAVTNTADLLELELTARTSATGAARNFARTRRAPSAACWRRSSRARTTTRSSCWRMGKWMRGIWPARRSSLEWTPRHCVRKTAKDCAPGAAPT